MLLPLRAKSCENGEMDNKGSGRASIEPGSSAIQRRDFLKRTLVVGWSAPVIMTIMSEHALAQSPGCGVLSSGGQAANRRCADNPACVSASRPVCCATATANATPCNCYPSTSSAGVISTTCV